jgi:DNA-binding transcriptional MerR regulator
MANPLPPIPVKRYFTIGEVGELCGVKPHVLRYWEQEFTQLRPMKRRGNRRYYQHHEVLMIRRIRDLLYDQGFTIIGARNKLQEVGGVEPTVFDADSPEAVSQGGASVALSAPETGVRDAGNLPAVGDLQALRKELFEICELLAETA